MHAPGPDAIQVCSMHACIMTINNLCIKAFFNNGRWAVRSCPRKSHSLFYKVFYSNCDSNGLLSYQIMSSPPHSQIDPSLTSAVYTLISPFSALSIGSRREEEVVESGMSKVLKEGEFLLENEVYIPTPYLYGGYKCRIFFTSSR